MTKGDRHAVRLRHGWNGALVTLVVGTSVCAAIFAAAGVMVHMGPDVFQTPATYRVMRVLWIPGGCVSLSTAVFVAAMATGAMPLASLRIVGRGVTVSYRSGFRRATATLNRRDLKMWSECGPYAIRSGREQLELTVLVFDDGVTSARVGTVARVAPDVVEAVGDWIESHRSDLDADRRPPGAAGRGTR